MSGTVEAADSDGGEASTGGLSWKLFIRCSCADSAERFLASHCFLMRSAAERVSASVGICGSSVGMIIGIALSCSFSWALKSLFGMRGGRRPRSRKAASRLSLLNALGQEGMVGRRETTGDETGKRALNFLVSIRITFRDLDRGSCKAACFKLALLELVIGDSGSSEDVGRRVISRLMMSSLLWRDIRC